MAEFQGLVTLTLDRVILHTIMHHSSTSTYIPNLIEIEETFLWTDGRTDIWDPVFIRSTRRSGPNETLAAGVQSIIFLITVHQVARRLFNAAANELRHGLWL